MTAGGRGNWAYGSSSVVRTSDQPGSFTAATTPGFNATSTSNPSPPGRAVRRSKTAPSATAFASCVPPGRSAGSVSGGAAAGDRDLKLMQGTWLPRKVWVGPGSQEAAAVLGGPITITDRAFRQEKLGGAENLARITALDAAKGEFELTFEEETYLGLGRSKGKVFRCRYEVGKDRFDLLRAAPGVDFARQVLPSSGVYEINHTPIGLNDGVRVDWCVRRKE